MKKSIFTASLVALILLFLLSIFLVGNPTNVEHLSIYIFRSLWALILALLCFLILRTGKISKYRSIFFVTFAFAFVLVFISHLIETRGSMALTQEVINNNETPLCPVALPMLILPAAIKSTLIFPTKLVGGSYGGFFPILGMWLVSIIALGRGWCSWGCFYGGLDEGFAKLSRTKIIPQNKHYQKLKWIPFVILGIIIIWSFLAMSPVYCDWLCPLKLVTEYVEITDLQTYLQAIIFITLGMGLLFILPFLTKKRTHCSFFCPLGALQSLVGKINPFQVTINKDKCIQCRRCISVCPHGALSEKLLEKGKVGITCSKCGLCIENCPSEAIEFTLWGRPLFSWKSDSKILQIGQELLAPSTIFVFIGLLFGGILSGSFVPEAFYRIYNLIISGSLLIN